MLEKDEYERRITKFYTELRLIAWNCWQHEYEIPRNGARGKPRRCCDYKDDLGHIKWDGAFDEVVGLRGETCCVLFQHCQVWAWKIAQTCQSIDRE